MAGQRRQTGHAVIAELAPLLKWLADVEFVLTGEGTLAYRHRTTDISYVCVPSGLFEHDGELWVVGLDPACNCVTGAPLRMCAPVRSGSGGR